MTKDHRRVRYNITIDLLPKSAELIEVDLVGLANSLAGRLQRLEYEDDGETVRVVGGPDTLVDPTRLVAHIEPSESDESSDGVPAWN